MPAIITRTPWTRQPSTIPRLDWSNPLTRGLQACVVPIGGGQFLELVTRVLGTSSGTYSTVIGAQGKSLRAQGVTAGAGNGTTTSDKVTWPVSSTLRGATLDATGTVLAVGGSTEQTDGLSYILGGTIDASAGDGFSMRIDSYFQLGRGNIIKATYLPKGTSSTELLGNPFGGVTHAFGYRFNGNGAAGAWLSSGISTSFSGQSTHGSTKTNRQLILFTDYTTGSIAAGNRKGFVAQLSLWDRELSDAEYASWYANPWQLFAPIERRIWVPSAAAGGVPTLSSATYVPGSLTNVGFRPRVTAS